MRSIRNLSSNKKQSLSAAICIAVFLTVMGFTPAVHAQTGRVHFHRRIAQEQSRVDNLGQSGQPHLLRASYGGSQQQPIAYARLYLFAVGTGGPNTGPISLLNTSISPVQTDPNNGYGYVTTDGGGGFSISGLYAMNCPSSTARAYMVAVGGSSGGQANNPYSVLVAAIGVPCAQMPNICCIGISEATTAAAAYALAAFADTNDLGLSTVAGNDTLLASAFAYANSLASSASGLPVSNSATQSLIDTVADIIGACNSSDGDPSSPCPTLMSDVTGPGAATPTDTWHAALSITENPTNNVSTLFNFISNFAAYQPTLSSAPPSWNVNISRAPLITGLSLDFATSGNVFTIAGTGFDQSDVLVIDGVTPNVLTSNGNMFAVLAPNGPITGVIQIYDEGSELGSNPVLTYPTSTSVSLSPGSATFGAQITATVTVSTSFGQVPSGTVTCIYNNAVTGTPTSLNASGVAIISVPYLPVGSDPITCGYSGNLPLQSSSSTASANITPATVGTTVTLSSSSNPANYGVLVSFTASVTAADGSTPTGIVTFYDGSQIIGAATLQSGTGSTATSTLIPGTHQISATYNGDSAHSQSTGSLNPAQVIANTPPLTSVNLAPAQSLQGDAVVALVYVTTSTSMPAQGSVTCTSPGVSTMSGTLNQFGQVSIQLPTLPIGQDLITCTYTSTTGNLTSSGTATEGVSPPGASSTGNMTTSRYLHTANLLTNGTVLIAGGVPAGQYYNNSLSSAEIYTASGTSGSFTATSPMNTPRQEASSVTLPDGTVLITGGINQTTTLNSAEFYDPNNGSPSFKEVGLMTAARYGHTATLLNNGQVLIVGGRNSSILSSAELYNPVTQSFTATNGSMQYQRVGHAAAILPSGNVLIVGGTNDNTVGLNTAEIYNVQTGTFSAAPTMPFGAELLTATPLSDGTILVAGGDATNSTTPVASAAIYSEPNNSFTTVGSMLTARSRPTATLMGNGLVLIAGGTTSSGVVSSLELYDPSTGNQTFSSAGNMTVPRIWQTATVLPSNAVLLAGGDEGSYPQNITASADLYSFDVSEGFVNLKYMVLGILYAPPGSGSTVTYTQGSTITDTTMISSDFKSTASLSITATLGTGYSIPLGSLATFGAPMVGAKSSITATTTFGYDTNSTSTSVTANTNSNSFTISGPTSSAIGIDHDYDEVILWLNPQQKISFPKTAYLTVNWAGLSYDGCLPNQLFGCDPNNDGNPDIYYVPILCLKAPYTPLCAPYYQAMQRVWDKSGLGALTLTDYGTIMAMDPFIANPNYNPYNDTSGSVSEESGSIYYYPAVAGQGPGLSGGTLSTTVTNTNSQAIARSYGISFMLSGQLTGGFIADFATSVSSTVGTTWTQTDTNSTADQNVSMVQYSVKTPLATDGYSGPGSFDVFRDNYYGTLMFFSPGRSTVPAASIGSSQSSFSFSGVTQVGASSTPETFTFTNDSTVPMAMTTSTALPTGSVGFSTKSFSIVSGGDQCTGMTLSPSQTCTVTIQFSPVVTDLQPSGTTTVNGTMIVAGVEEAPGSTNVLITAHIPLSGVGTP